MTLEYNYHEHEIVQIIFPYITEDTTKEDIRQMANRICEIFSKRDAAENECKQEGKPTALVHRDVYENMVQNFQQSIFNLEEKVKVLQSENNQMITDLTLTSSGGILTEEVINRWETCNRADAIKQCESNHSDLMKYISLFEGKKIQVTDLGEEVVRLRSGLVDIKNSVDVILNG